MSRSVGFDHSQGPKAVWPHRRWCAESQDVHTPRVIASGFIEVVALRTPPTRIRAALSQAFMDEVDGRPGPVALQFGHLNALHDVPKASLSLAHPTFSCTVILNNPHNTVILSERSESKDLRFRSFPSTQLPRLFSGADQPKAASPTAGGHHPHRRWRRTV